MYLSGDGDIDYFIYRDFAALNEMDPIDGGRIDFDGSPARNALALLDNFVGNVR